VPCPAQLEGDLGAAGEGVEEGRGRRRGEEALAEHAVGADAVEEQRQAGPAGDPEVGLEHRDLAIAGGNAREAAEVEAALADRDEARRSAPKGVEKPHLKLLIIVLGQIAEGVGVDSKSGVKAHAWRFRAQRVRRVSGSGPRSRLHPGEHDCCDFRMLGAQGGGSLLLGTAKAR